MPTDPLARSGQLKILEGEHGSGRAFTVGIHQVQIEQVRYNVPESPVSHILGYGEESGSW
jgi:hypothetical protein